MEQVGGSASLLIITVMRICEPVFPIPYVFGPSGSESGSIIYLYGSGSESFHQQEKKLKP